MKYVFASFALILLMSLGLPNSKNKVECGAKNPFPIKLLWFPDEKEEFDKANILVNPLDFTDFKSFKKSFFDKADEYGTAKVYLENNQTIYHLNTIDCFGDCCMTPPSKWKNTIVVTEFNAQTFHLYATIADWNEFFFKQFNNYGTNMYLSDNPRKLIILIDFMDETDISIVHEHLLKIIEAFDYVQENTDEKLELNIKFEKEFCPNLFYHKTSS